MNFHLSHHRPRVERSRPDVAIGWTVRVTITDGETQIYNDFFLPCREMALDPPPRRTVVDELVGRHLRDPNGVPKPPLEALIEQFEQRRRFADVMNFPLSED